MNRELQIIGAGGGGKGGGGGGGIKEDPDTLSSVAYARIVELLSEGPIKGLVNGEYSIYLDGVPLRDSAGTPNYKPFKWAFTAGTQSQPPIAGFSGTQASTAVGVALTVSAGRIVRTISDPDADSVRITVSVNALTQTTSKGKIQGTKVEYTISVRRQGSPTWTNNYPQVINGKTGSRYQKSTEVNLSELGAGPYEVSVIRTTADSTSALLVNGLNWDDYTVINYERFSYPNSALVALELDARYFNQIPARTYHVKGLLVRVPSNYNPITRRYTGSWDGTFQIAYTNNPAWCFFDLLTSDRYGLGKRITDAQANKWLMYQIGKYCDELVPTGLSTNVYDISASNSFSSQGLFNAGPPKQTGRLEPRFTLNCVINTREDAYKILNYLSSVFRGMTYWSGGMVAVSQDAPTTPDMIWTNANVIDGLFTYEGSSRTQRHTTCTVAWNDPSEDYKQKFEYVEDREGIERYGVRPTDVVGFGCTSRSQAHRQGLYILLTERLEQEVIKFSVGLDSAEVVPGMVGQIYDYKRVGVRWGGRILSHTINSVNLDAPVTLTAGTYTLSVMSVEGSVITRSVVITADGTYNNLTTTTNFTSAPVNMAVWTLASTAITPILGRVISVKQINSSVFEISCVRHDPSKYDAIDYGTPLVPQTYSTLKYDGAPGIGNLLATEVTYKTADTARTITNLDISWDTSSDPLVRGYKLVVATASGVPVREAEVTKPSYTLENVLPDTYVVTVSTISQFAVLGVPSSVTTTVSGVDRTRPSDVSSFTSSIVNGTVVFTWNQPTDLDYASTILQVGTAWSDSATPLVNTKSNTFTWPWPAAGTYQIFAKHKDTSGNLSLNAVSTSVTVADTGDSGFLTTPPTPTDLTATGALKSVFLSWKLTRYPNHSYVQIYRATINSSGSATVIGTSTSDLFADFSAAAGTTYYYWIKAVGYLGDGTPIYSPFNAVGGTVGGPTLIGNSDLGPLIVEAAQLASGAVTAGKLAANSIAVGTAAVENAAITTAMIANLAVTNALIANLAVDNAKIANLAVDNGKIANLAVDNAKIANLAVDGAKIANLAVDNAKIANAAITSAKIGDAQVTTLQIGDEAVLIPRLAQSRTTAVTSTSSSPLVLLTLSSVTVPSTAPGTSVALIFTMKINCNSLSHLYVKIQRDSTDLATFDFPDVSPVGSSSDYDFTYQILDTPGAGSFIYRIIAVNGNVGGTFGDRSILLLGAKR